ncbi:hypothetical protein AVEN_154820-1 [Araneus ventricosus]|uniref:Uncharacterized protein n=1 Tax=Araneus ventricosus TaxID=182803 RepID=A0A4Y2BWD1_ARAVE|nr:hypothetical protein AVEN_154820-1 [Araneus ventricosus]
MTQVLIVLNEIDETEGELFTFIFAELSTQTDRYIGESEQRTCYRILRRYRIANNSICAAMRKQEPPITAAATNCWGKSLTRKLGCILSSDD